MHYQQYRSCLPTQAAEEFFYDGSLRTLTKEIDLDRIFPPLSEKVVKWICQTTNINNNSTEVFKRDFKIS